MSRRNEEGHALIEVLLIGLLLLIPLVWTLSVLSELHRGALAATAAVREAGTDAGRATDLSAAEVAIDAAVARSFVDHGLEASDARVAWAAGTFQRGGTVEVVVRYPVEVLRIPFLGAVGGPSVWVEAKHVGRIESFGSRG